MRLALAAVTSVLLVACAQPPKPAPKPPPKPQYFERVILLPSQDGRASAVVVSRAGKEAALTTPYQSLEVAGGTDRSVVLSESEVRKLHSELLQAQPARPITYVLHFNLRSTELTPQSKNLLAEIHTRVAAFPAAQVMVIGHADRVGSDAANDALSLKRAVTIRDLLVKTGIAKDLIEVVGRGEREPVVVTPDGKADERNRRVEIKLR